MNTLTSEEYVKEATRIAEAGKRANIILRVMGACAIRLHSPKSQTLLDSLDRKITDLDFISYLKFEEKLNGLFGDLGYRSESNVSKYYAHMYGQVRGMYIDATGHRKVDVFFDKLEMCHKIDLRNRLEVDFPTLSLSDLLLEKMQIVKLNEKDVIDTFVLVLEHDIGEEDRETINSKYVSKVLADDWGFYHTVTTNLRKIIELLSQYKALSEVEKNVIEKRVKKLLDAIEEQPKSLRWKMRARVGTSRKWYSDVDEVSMGAAR